MAIVFVSPKNNRKMALNIAIAVFVVVLIAVALFIFFSKSEKVPIEKVFKKPPIDIDFDLLTSEQMKYLEPFAGQPMQFDYTGISADNKEISGTILAVSKEEALVSLQGQNISGIVLEKSKYGRENPFVPYYSVPTQEKTKTK